LPVINGQRRSASAGPATAQNGPATAQAPAPPSLALAM
jgi:hypothetical protein